MRRIYFTFFLLFLASSFYAQTHTWTRTNPGGGGAFSTIEAGPPANNGAMQIIAASDLSGAYYSWDGGQSWDVYGAERSMFGTHVSAIGFHPTSAEIFFLGTEGGIYRSTTGGGFFTVSPMNDGNNPARYITDIEVSAANSQIVYAAHHTHYFNNDGKVYKSTDGGANFSVVSNSTLPNNLHILEIVAHPLNEDIVYALSGDGRGSGGLAAAYRSTNGGVNWTKLNPPTSAEVMHIAITGNTLYLTTIETIANNGICQLGNAGKIYKSTDSGSTWGGSALADYTGIIFIDFNNPQTIRLIDPRCPFPGLTGNGTWTTTDGGNNWIQSETDAWDIGYVDPGVHRFWSYETGYNGFSKTIGGSKTDPDAFFWINYRWVFGTSDGGQHFTHLHTTTVGNNFWQSTGVDNVVMNDIAISPAEPNEIYLGFADNGIWRSIDGGQSWQESNPAAYTASWQGVGGNSHTILPDPDVAGRVWANLQGNNDEQAYLLYSEDSGERDSWTDLTPADFKIENNEVTEIKGLSLDKNSPIHNRTLFMTADGDVYRSTNHGDSWQKVLMNGGLYYTAVDQMQGNIVYAAGAVGIYRSTTGGNSWSQIVNTAGGTSDPYLESYDGISSIVTDPDVAGKMYFSRCGVAGGVYRWQNGMVSAPLYSNPYVRCVAVNPSNSNQLYAGSSYAFYKGIYHEDSKGVLYSADGGDTWTEVNGDMPWTFAVRMAMTTETSPRIFVGNTGTGFQYAPVGGDMTLAVNAITNLQAIQELDKIKISWTNLPTDIEQIEVQRLANKESWQPLERVSVSDKTTFVYDEQPLNGTNFYRLALYNHHNEVEWSEIVSVDLNDPALYVAPNPFYENLFLQIKSPVEETLQIAIYNSQGKQLFMQPIPIHTNTAVEVKKAAQLSAGIYFIKVINPRGNIVYSSKILKN